MSGFEVAGVVLGALPLIITAVDKYKATAGILKNFRHKEPHVQKLIQALESQKFCVESELVIIWNGAFSKEDHVPIPPTSNDFKSPMVALAIQKHLGPGYQHFIAALSRCEEALVEIATHLHGLASDGQVWSLNELLDSISEFHIGSFCAYSSQPTPTEWVLRVHKKDQVRFEER